MTGLSLRTQREEGVRVLALRGELDLASVPALRQAAIAELDDPAATELVLDLAELTFVDSTGTGCWVELHNRAEQAGKTLRLRAVPESVQRVLAIGGLATLFDIA